MNLYSHTIPDDFRLRIGNDVPWAEWLLDAISDPTLDVLEAAMGTRPALVDHVVVFDRVLTPSEIETAKRILLTPLSPPAE